MKDLRACEGMCCPAHGLIGSHFTILHKLTALLLACAVNDEEYLAENLQKDYIAWSNGPSRATRPFSLCSYPFVYEPAAKATILGMSNFNTQMGEFHDALRESMSWGGGSAVPFLVLRVCSADLSPGSCNPHDLCRRTCTGS